MSSREMLILRWGYDGAWVIVGTKSAFSDREVSQKIGLDLGRREVRDV